MQPKSTNLGHQVTTFCTVAPAVYGSPLWNLLHVTCLAPIVLSWLLDFWNTYAPLHTGVYTYNK
jgi:hypothetical protein